MNYDFDQIIDRSQNHRAKYDERIRLFGTAMETAFNEGEEWPEQLETAVNAL